VCAETELRG